MTPSATTPSATTPAAVPVRPPRWVSTIVVLGAALTVAGAVIALVRPGLLLPPGAAIDAATRLYANYFVSRNLALAAMLLAGLALRARRVLGGLMLLSASIQVVDVVLDAADGRWMLVPGLLVFAGAFLAGAARLSGQPFWRAAAWRDRRGAGHRPCPQ